MTRSAQDPVRILVTGHLLLQVRTRVLNNDLTHDFHRWYPSFTHTTTDRRDLAA
ncbi:MAG: hypothetical protein ACRDRS_05140 [Pseudonocardiaceae bacterium]